MLVDGQTQDVHRNAEELKRFLQHVGWKQYEADRKAGVAMGRTASYLAGRYQPNVEYLDRLARASGLAQDWRSLTIPLYAAIDKPVQFVPVTDPASDITELPYRGIIPAASGVAIPSGSSPYVKVPRRYSGDNRFVVKVAGSSMEPALYQADMLVMEQDEGPPLGVAVLAEGPGEERTIKQLSRDASGFVTKPVNAYSDAKPDDEPWQPIARMVGIIRVVEGTEVLLYNPAGITPRALILGTLRGAF